MSMDTHPAKRVEIVIEAPLQRRLEDALAEAGRALPVLRAGVAALPAGSPERLALAAQAALWEGRAASARRVLAAHGWLDDVPPPSVASPEDDGDGDDTPPAAPALAPVPRMAA